MKLIKQIDIGWLIIFIAIVFRMLETWFFGWNATPINDYELWCDRISDYIFYLGMFFVINPLFQIYYRTCKRIDRE